jgi:1-acyl-sn-glycerol-3-phosphate acyltransferase
MMKRPPRFRNLIHSIVRALFRFLSRLEVVDLDNVPAQGACILAVNHLSRLDPPLVFAVIDRPDLTALVTTKYKRFPFYRFLVDAVGGVWIRREEADMSALRESLGILRAGGAIGIAPEGTRSPTGGLLPAKTGVAYLADKAPAPVVPVAITGNEGAWLRLLRLRRPRIRIQFGAPLHFPPVQRQDREATLQAHTDEIMCRMAAMLPPSYRGVYADHPRLQELLDSARARDSDVVKQGFSS